MSNIKSLNFTFRNPVFFIVAHTYFPRWQIYFRLVFLQTHGVSTIYADYVDELPRHSA